MYLKDLLFPPACPILYIQSALPGSSLETGWERKSYTIAAAPPKSVNILFLNLTVALVLNNPFRAGSPCFL